MNSLPKKSNYYLNKIYVFCVVHKLSEFITKKGEFITKINEVPFTAVTAQQLEEKPNRGRPANDSTELQKYNSTRAASFPKKEDYSNCFTNFGSRFI